MVRFSGRFCSSGPRKRRDKNKPKRADTLSIARILEGDGIREGETVDLWRHWPSGEMVLLLLNLGLSYRTKAETALCACSVYAPLGIS